MKRDYEKGAVSGNIWLFLEYMVVFGKFLGKNVNLDPPAKIEVGGVLPPDLIDLMSEISPLSNDEEINEGKNELGKKENKKMFGN